MAQKREWRISSVNYVRKTQIPLENVARHCLCVKIVLLPRALPLLKSAIIFHPRVSAIFPFLSSPSFFSGPFFAAGPQRNYAYAKCEWEKNSAHQNMTLRENNFQEEEMELRHIADSRTRRRRRRERTRNPLSALTSAGFVAASILLAALSVQGQIQGHDGSLGRDLSSQNGNDNTQRALMSDSISKREKRAGMDNVTIFLYFVTEAVSEWNGHFELHCPRSCHLIFSLEGQ